MLAHDQWRTFGQADGWTGDYARTIVERADGDLLITTFDGHVLEFTDDRFEELPDPPGEPGEGYVGFVDDAGRWCVGATCVHRPLGWNALAGNDCRGESAFATGWYGPRTRRRAMDSLGRELSKYRDGKRLIHHTLEGLSGGIWSTFETCGQRLDLLYETGLYRVDPGSRAIISCPQANMSFTSAPRITTACGTPRAAQLAFTVTPHYWQTASFRFGGIVLLVTGSSGAAWWAASSRQRHRRQAEERFRIVVEAAPAAMI